MWVCGCGCLYESMCVCICVYICVRYYRLVIKYHQLTLQANNYIHLLHSRQQNKQTNKNYHCGGRLKLISSAETSEQKWLYRNLHNSRSGHQLMSPTTSITIFNCSLYLQLQNAKRNLPNYTVTSPFNRERNYTCIGWHSSLERTNKKKEAKLNIKTKNKTIIFIIIKIIIIIVIIKHGWN